MTSTARSRLVNLLLGVAPADRASPCHHENSNGQIPSLEWSLKLMTFEATGLWQGKLLVLQDRNFSSQQQKKESTGKHRNA